MKLFNFTSLVIFLLFTVLGNIVSLTSSVKGQYEEKSMKRIFIDNGGFPYHGEVVYAVAVLMTKRIYPDWTMKFILSKYYAKRSGVLGFWRKHVREGVLGELSLILLYSIYVL